MICTYFVHFPHIFARILGDFSQIFTNSKLLGVRLHPLHPRLLHQCDLDMQNQATTGLGAYDPLVIHVVLQSVQSFSQVV